MAKAPTVNVCRITYIKRGGETVTVVVDPKGVEKRENGDVTFRTWDIDTGFTSVWVSSRYLISIEFATMVQKGHVDG